MSEIVITAFLIGLIFAPLGCLVLWQRSIYLGDGLAHASILAGTISIIFALPMLISGLLLVGLFGLAIMRLGHRSGNNAAIGLVSSVAMSAALVIAALYPGSINFEMLLFGNIISASSNDLIGLTVLLAAVALFFGLFYKQLLILSFSRDIAFSRGINVKLISMIFLSILGFAILYTIKIVGALLVTSIIIIPAVTASLIGSTPLRMILWSIVIVLLMNSFGVLISLNTDLPFAPLIVLSGGVLLLLVLGVRRII